MIFRVVIVLLSSVAGGLAAPGESVIETLIARAWQPLPVTVEWSSTGALPLSVAAHEDWTLTSQLPARPCGALIVQLERTSAGGESSRVSVSGNCRVRVDTYTVDRTISAGQPLAATDLVPTTVEWKPAFGEPIHPALITTSTVAARAIIPGRPVTTSDLKSADTIQRGQRVSLIYETGSVRVTLPARALSGGAPGEIIQFATMDSPSKVYKGRIQPDGHVQICF